MKETLVATGSLQQCEVVAKESAYTVNHRHQFHSMPMGDITLLEKETPDSYRLPPQSNKYTNQDRTV